MYDINSLTIATTLFATMLVAMEVGYRIGRRRHSSHTETTKSHVNTIQASLLGVLALLLGFTFSLALQRHDSRSVAVVDEANAVGTTYLRATLLPESVRADARLLLRDYVAGRMKGASIDLAQEEERAVQLAKSSAQLAALWELARRAAEEDPNPVTTGLFIQALNEQIDALGRRDAALSRHVPEVVLLLLYFTFLMTATIVGYAAGVAGHRASFVSYLMVALIVLLVFIIVDLDRPRRGLIEVSQKSFADLAAAMAVDGQESPAVRAPPH